MLQTGQHQVTPCLRSGAGGIGDLQRRPRLAAQCIACATRHTGHGPRPAQNGRARHGRAGRIRPVLRAFLENFRRLRPPYFFGRGANDSKKFSQPGEFRQSRPRGEKPAGLVNFSALCAQPRREHGGVIGQRGPGGILEGFFDGFTVAG